MTDPLSRVKASFSASISDALEKLGVSRDKVAVRRTPSLDLGDLGSPIAFDVAKQLHKNPDVVASDLAKGTDVSSVPFADRLRAKGGFINLFLDRSAFMGEVIETARRLGEEFGRSEVRDGRIMVEHTSANPCSPLHVGSGRNAVIGDSFANMLEMLGHRVIRHYLVNDSGRQVSILAYARSRVQDLEPEGKPDHWYGRLYAAVNCLLEIAKLEREGREEEAQDWLDALADIERDHPELVSKLRKRVAEDEDPEQSIADLNRRYQLGKDGVAKALFREMTRQIMEGFMKTLSRLGARYDSQDWETDLIWQGWVEKGAKRLQDAGYLVKEDRAVYVDMLKAAKELEAVRNLLGSPEEITKSMPPAFYLSRSDGTWLYTGTDVGYSLYKLEGLDVKKSYNVVGSDQNLPQLQLRASLAIMGLRPERLPHFSYGMVELPAFKMSGRTGRYISLDETMGEAKGRVVQLLKEREGLEEGEIEEISERVAIGALRYALIGVAPTKNLVFTWGRVLNLEENSGPFIQYSYTRARSILKKAGSLPKEFDPSLLKEVEEIELAYKVAELPEIIRTSVELMRPDIAAQFANELAALFNRFYERCRVLSAEQGLSWARLALVQAASIALGNSLRLLGIPRPEKM